ncbi:Na+/H+ antiporter NhaA [Mariniluteicoccus flavus]
MTSDKRVSPTSPTSPDVDGSGAPRRRLFAGLGADDARVLPDLLRQETVGGALMLVATVAALIWANVGHESYDHVRHVYLGPLSLQHWAADGLLTIFFFVAGLELKRELTSGSLANPREALVPIVAALAGMVVPAGIYVAVNGGLPGGHTGGWAIPMATDIAFALAILAAVGSRLPTSLRAFLLTLAIVDDLGAILVIATVFTESISLLWLALALGCAVVWWLLQRKHVDHWAFYVPLFVIAWWAMLQSGVHATIAGVLLGLLTRSAADDPVDPADAWGHFWHPISAGLVVPIFALLSAGVAVNVPALKEVVTNPVGLGILLGLVVGKPIGVFGGAWLTARFTRAELASDLRWREVFAVSSLAGVGFTVALFVSELAFKGDAHLVDGAKAAVLVASIAAAVIAGIALNVLSRRRADPDQIDA